MGYFLLVLLLVWVILVWVETGFRPAQAVRKWLKEPGNPVRLATWVIAIVVVALTLLSPIDTLLGGLRSEAISTAFAVIVINELGIYRAALQEKRSIIEQMGSQANDAALEAVRLARKNGWLQDGSLKGAILVEANLEGANLMGAKLDGADLSFANLEGANLMGAKLRDAILWDTKLRGAHLWLAKLEGATLIGAKLRGAYLWDANLTGVDLSRANLTGAYLGDTKLEGADLGDAHLTAYMQFATPAGATLIGAKLRGADLEGAHLTGTDLRGAMYDTHTIWPEDFDPVQAGAKMVSA